jgi:CBS domain containing-hemolysin-like protein
METINQSVSQCQGPELQGLRTRMTFCGIFALLIVCHAMPAEASLFKGEMLDKVADLLSWVVLIVGPVIGIVVFWLLHILPEKIAEKKKHPQAKAIQALCLLSLFFGGLLWPFAWLWAYTKPVFHKMAYGTDMDEHEHGGKDIPTPAVDDTQEVRRLRARLAELEAKQAMDTPVTLGGRV